MTRFVLEHAQQLRPAFGSHNVRSVAYAMAYAEALGLPPRSYEIQMLYGMADPIKDALVAMGRRVRVYTPYGELLPGMAYLVRRLLENTANESFLRASFTDTFTRGIGPRSSRSIAGISGQSRNSASLRTSSKICNVASFNSYCSMSKLTNARC